jgi:hypothetical protein
MKQFKLSRDMDQFKPVQSAITSVSFPETLDLLRKMGTKWLGLVGKDWITDMDILVSFPAGNNITWIAPKWLTSGDILFFYHTKNARLLINKLSKEVTRLIDNPLYTSVFSKSDIELLNVILIRQTKLANLYSGTLFGYATVSGKPQLAYDENKHFKGVIYAPLDSFQVFSNPLPAEEFADVLKIGQNTTTPMYSEQFESIKNKLRIKNKLLPNLENTRPSGLGFRDISSNNWMEISCNQDIRFVNEAQLRTYLIDYLLEEIKDTHTLIYTECDCFHSGRRTGIADYFIKFAGRWLPVEAKLNILAEQDIIGQIEKYTNINSFTPTNKNIKGKLMETESIHFCLVVDQSGIYLVKDDKFFKCNPDTPLLSRREIPIINPKNIREKIILLLNLEIDPD